MMIREGLADRRGDAVDFQRGEELLRIRNSREGQNRFAGKRRHGVGFRTQVAMEHPHRAPLGGFDRALCCTAGGTH